MKVSNAFRLSSIDLASIEKTGYFITDLNYCAYFIVHNLATFFCTSNNHGDNISQCYNMRKLILLVFSK